jgi:hypothetical protein
MSPSSPFTATHRSCRWLGAHHETGEDLVGVELDTPAPDDDSSFSGVIAPASGDVNFVYFEPCAEGCGVLVPPDRVQINYDSMTRVALTMLLQRRGVDISRAFTEEDFKALARGEELTGCV